MTGQKEPTNPWRIIGWIVLGFMVLGLSCCGLIVLGIANKDYKEIRSKAEATASAPPYSVHASVECTGRGRDRANITIDNNGAEIPYAKAFVEFADSSGKVVSSNDGYFSPTTVPRNARASAGVYSAGVGSSSCRLVRIQDGDGNPVTIL